MTAALYHLIFRALVVTFIAVPLGVFAQDTAEPAAPAEPAAIPESLQSPRATMATFPDAMNAIRAGDEAHNRAGHRDPRLVCVEPAHTT